MSGASDAREPATPDEQKQPALFAAAPFLDAWQRCRDNPRAQMTLDHAKSLLLAHFKGGRPLPKEEGDKAWDVIREYFRKEGEKRRRSLRSECRKASEGHDIEDQDGYHGQCRSCGTWFIRSEQAWQPTDGDPRGVTFGLTTPWAKRSTRIEMTLAEALAILLEHYTEGFPISEGERNKAWQMVHDDLRQPFERLHRNLSARPY